MLQRFTSNPLAPPLLKRVSRRVKLALPLALAVVLTGLRSQGDEPGQRLTEFDGVTEPSQEVLVAAAADGLIASIEVDRGSTVAKGQIVATLESSVQATLLDVAEARTELTADLRRQEASLEFHRLKEQRDERLFQKGIISDQVFAQSHRDRRLAEANLLQAEEDLRLAKLERDHAQARLTQRTIRSPLDGVVVERLMSPGELVTQGRNAEILKVAQINPLHVEVILPVEIFGSVEVGMLAEIRLDSSADTHPAAVTVVDRVVDAASGTFGIRLELANENGDIPAGVKCRVRLVRE